MFRTGRGVLPAFILIALGVFFLLSEFYRLPNGSVLVALGLAFLAYHFCCNRYGAAVAGTILTAMGAYAMLNQYRISRGADAAWFLLILGVSLLFVYAIGMRRDRLWPLVLGAIFTSLGALALAGVAYPVVPFYLWRSVVSWWPLLLVVLGLWLLVRDRLEPGERRIVGGLATLMVLMFAALIVVSWIGFVGGGGRPWGHWGS